MNGVGTKSLAYIRRRIRACDYITVAELYLRDNFLLERELIVKDIKPRLLGHWGTCHGINVAYTNLKTFFAENPNFSFILGPGHGFPALQANLFLDGDLLKVDEKATTNYDGLAYLCRNFSWPDGFPSHASPFTPGIIVEGGELGYALANAYGACLGHPEKTIAVLIGDGELETATALDSLNLESLVGGKGNGKVLPILHLNGYKISGPTIYGRKSERELLELIRGFGFTPTIISGTDHRNFQKSLARDFRRRPADAPFYILKSEKGETGPNRNDAAHQIPLKNVYENRGELKALEDWLKSYHFEELFNRETGFTLEDKK